MRSFLFISIVLALVAMGGGSVSDAVAQANSNDLGSTLSRLKNNPRYQGRILGTHIVNKGGRSLYEVRILRRDDRVILVYIDPDTGGVVGDSERNNIRKSRNKEKRIKRNNRKNKRRNR